MIVIKHNDEDVTFDACLNCHHIVVDEIPDLRRAITRGHGSLIKIIFPTGLFIMFKQIKKYPDGYMYKSYKYWHDVDLFVQLDLSNNPGNQSYLRNVKTKKHATTTFKRKTY